MRCKLATHDVDARDYVTHKRSDGKTFSYCTSHEPLKGAQLERLKRWARGP